MGASVGRSVCPTGLAGVTSTDFSIAFGGFACVVGIFALALLWPSFRRYDVREARAAATEAAAA